MVLSETAHKLSRPHQSDQRSLSSGTGEEKEGGRRSGGGACIYDELNMHIDRNLGEICYLLCFHFQTENPPPHLIYTFKLNCF